MCSSSHALCYVRVQSCVIHNSFASYGGTSFALVTLAKLNASESEQNQNQNSESEPDQI